MRILILYVIIKIAEATAETVKVFSCSYGSRTNYYRRCNHEGRRFQPHYYLFILPLNNRSEAKETRLCCAYMSVNNVCYVEKDISILIGPKQPIAIVKCFVKTPRGSFKHKTDMFSCHHINGRQCVSERGLFHGKVKDVVDVKQG